MKKVRVRGIIRTEEGIIFIHRIREVDGEKNEYFVFPGGGLEKGETVLEGIKREIVEELGIQIDMIKTLYTAESEKDIQHYILCEYLSGKFGTGEGPEYNSEEYKDRGLYIPEIVKYEELSEKNIVPIEIKELIIEDTKKTDKKLDKVEQKYITVKGV